MNQAVIIEQGCHAVLENLAVALGGLPEAARRHAGRAMEGAREVAEVGKTHVERHIGHGPVVVRQQACRVAQAGADQVLVRRDAEHLREQAKEMEGAQARFGGRAFEPDVVVRIGIDPDRGIDRTAPVARRGGLRQ